MPGPTDIEAPVFSRAKHGRHLTWLARHGTAPKASARSTFARMAAIANAIKRAVGMRLTELPMSPPKVLAAIDAGEPK
jgi:hypothetical protein